MSGDEGSNITQTLTNLFEEMLLETEMTSENRSNVDFSQFLSALREQSSKNSSHEPLDFGALVKLVDGWRSRLNLTRPSEPACTYCEGNFRDIILAYNSIHGYISLIAFQTMIRELKLKVETIKWMKSEGGAGSQDRSKADSRRGHTNKVCFFGSLANALNVAVLTRRDLAAAPINRLLKWLAVADVFVMLEYVPFAIYRYLILPGQREMPYKWAAYLLFHMHFAQVFHTASICLTLSLAVWRYVAIKYSDKNHILCTERRCSTAILSSFLLPPILCIPTYMVFDIHTAIVLEPSGPMILYHVDSDEEGQLYQINFWVHAVVIKLLPCCILTIISLWLIREVYSANQHQKKIRVYNKCPTNNKAVKRQYKADRRTNRTTKMLVAVLLLFLVTELPQGILGLLSGLLGRCFFKRCYDLFGELMDALALLNGAINFVLYCSMSRQFRMTFGQMMWRAHLHRWPPPTASHSDGQNTAKSSIP